MLAWIEKNIFQTMANYRSKIEMNRTRLTRYRGGRGGSQSSAFLSEAFQFTPGVKKSRKYSFRGFTPGSQFSRSFSAGCDGRVPRFILPEEDFVNNAGGATSSPLDGLFTRSANYFVRKLVYFARGNRNVRRLNSPL